MRTGSPTTGHRILWAITLALVVLCLPAPGRSQEVEDTDAQIWLDYHFHGGARERLRTSFDLGYRQVVGEEALIGDWLRVHLRGGLAWQRKDWLALEAGAGAFYTHEKQDEVADTTEIRPWQGVKLYWPSVRAPRRIVLTHFFRLEERIFVREGETDFGLRRREDSRSRVKRVPASHSSPVRIQSTVLPNRSRRRSRTVIEGPSTPRSILES